MSTTNPLISIILPTFNGKAAWLWEAVDSVINQTYSNRELIVINDASTNDIEKVILHYVDTDNRILYVKNEENMQLTRSLNKWIELSKWKYIARIDDDDIWCDYEKLSKQARFMEKNPEYGLCGTSGYIINEKGEIIEEFSQRKTDESIKKTLLASNQFTHCSVLIRKSVLEDVWYYNPQHNLIEDYELRLRIGTKYKLYNLQDRCVMYRINTQSVSNKHNKKQQIMNIKITSRFRYYYPWFYNAVIKKIWYLLLPKALSQKILRYWKS